MKRVFLFVAILLSYRAYSQLPKKNTTIIAGTASFLREGDTVKLRIVKYGAFNAIKEFTESFASIVKNSDFQFSISLCIPAYFDIVFSQTDRKLNLYSYLIEPGFNISVNLIKPDSFEFSGKDSKKLRIQYERRKMRMAGLHRVTDWSTTNISRTLASLDSLSIKELAYLKSNKDALGNTLYTVLYADVLGESGSKIDNFLPYNSPEKLQIWGNALKDYSDPVWNKYNSFISKSNFLQYSYTYANALIARYRWDSCIILNAPFNIIHCYEYFVKNLSGTLRERVITTLLYENKNETSDLSYCLQSTFGFIINKDFETLLRNLNEHVTEGSAAFTFKLRDTSGILRDFKEFNGKVILLDFWFTGCKGCIEVHPKLDSITSLYKKDQLVLISISVDKDRKKWVNSINKGIYTSQHSINLFTDGIGDTHPIISHYLIEAYPKLILIDRKGRLCNNPIDPRLDNGKDLIRMIDESL